MEMEQLDDEKMEFKGAMELEEEINLDALRKIRDNFSVVFRRMGGFKALNEKTKAFQSVDEKTALTVVNELYHEKCKTNKVKYRHVARLTSGRRFAKLSLQGLHRQVRHAIAKEIYHDVDIKNCHPVLTYELCKKWEFTHRILKMYVENRDDCIERWKGTIVQEYNETTKGMLPKILRNKDDVKQYFLKLLYGGGNKRSNNEELNECYERNQDLLEKAYKDVEFKRHRDRAISKFKKAKEEEWDNKRGSCFSYYLGEVEDNILTQMELYLQEQNVGYGCLCFDGLMVYKKSVRDLDELLKGLELRLLERMGYAIGLSCKPMEEDVDISDLSIKEDLKTSDEDYALFFLESLKEDIKYDRIIKQLWFYDEDMALWREQKMRHLRILMSKKLTPYIQTSPDPDVIEAQLNLIKSDKFQSSLVRMCEPWIENKSDELFIRTHFDKKKGLFPISNNQVVDLRTGVARERLKEDYFTKTTQRKLVDLGGQRTWILKYFTDLLTPVGSETPAPDHLRDNLIMTMAYILTGEHLKKIFNFIGKPDGGKSLFLEMMCSVLEGFSSVGNTRLFVAQKTKSVHDSELFNLIGKKMTCISETDEKECYNEELLKKISGGDAVNIRGASEKQTIDMVFNTVLVIACNIPSQFKDEAFMSRLVCFNFCNKFVKSASFSELVKENTDLFFSLFVEYAQKFYTTQTIDWCKEVQSFTQETCETQDTIKVWIREDSPIYVVKDQSKYIIRADLYESYKNYWTGNNRKWEGKNTFFKKIEEIYKVQAVKIAGEGMGWRGLSLENL